MYKLKNKYLLYITKIKYKSFNPSFTLNFHVTNISDILSSHLIYKH